MLEMPMNPPVNSSWSSATCSTMIPNAMVTMAR